MNLITIAGTDYPVKYGRMALSKTLALVGAKGLHQAEKIDQMPVEKWGQMVLFGIETGCKIQDIEPPTLEEVDEALDLDLSVFTIAQEQFLSDMQGGKKPETEGN